MRDLKNKAVIGAMWNTIQTLTNKGLSFIFLLIMARILQPKDYGIVGLVAVFMIISDAFIDSGFGQALVRKQNRTRVDESTVFYFNIVASIGCYLILFIIAPFVGDFYNIPELSSILRVLGIRLVISSFSTIHVLKYSIDLNFKILAIIYITCNFLSGTTGIILAYNGFGVWALVLQQVLYSFISAIIFNVVSRWKPIWDFSWKSFHEMFSFGSKLLGQRLLNCIYSNISTIFIGKAYSASDLGLYSKGNELAGYPTNIAYSIIISVSYPVLCTLQNDREKLTLLYRKLLGIVAYILSPIMTFLFFFAQPIMANVFGEQWSQAGIYIMLLCYPNLLVPIISINLNLLQVVGRSDLILRLEIISKILGTIMLLITLPISIEAMCYGTIINTVLSLILFTYYTSKFIDLTLKQQLIQLIRSLLLSVLIGLLVYFLTLNINSGFVKLFVALILGGTLYFGISASLKLREFKELLTLLKKNTSTL